MLQQLRSGAVAADELYELCHGRIRAIERLNAYVHVGGERSRAQVQRSVQRYAKGEPRALEGVPVAVKDNFCTRGTATTCASRALRSFAAPYDAGVVGRLLDAGAVLVGKTNLDEFGMGSGTTESVFGPTRNPWRCRGADADDFCIAGGSSGGSAVAVATGTCYAALGSDTGGSVRNPASYCGVVGLKPSYGVATRHGLIPLVNSMDVPGVLAGSVSACRHIFDVIVGLDPKDPTTVPRQRLRPSKLSLLNASKDRPLEGLTVGIPSEMHCPGLSDDVVDVWRRTADLLEKDLGARLVSVSLPHTQYSIACYSVLNACEVASNMARYDGLRYGHRADAVDAAAGVDGLYAASRSQSFNDTVRGRILAGNFFLLRENYAKYVVQAMKLRRLIADDYDAVWRRGVDLLLMPVTLSTAPLFSDFSQRDSRAQSSLQDFCTQPANMAGLPALSLPVGVASGDGLPLALQLVAPLYDDATLLDAARGVEDAVAFRPLPFPEPIDA